MFVRQVQPAMETVSRQFEPVGPSERAAFDEGAGEVGGVGERTRHDGIACDEIGGGSEYGCVVREYELQGIVTNHGGADQLDHQIRTGVRVFTESHIY